MPQTPVLNVLELSATAAAGYAGSLLAELGFCVARLACPGAAPESIGGELFLHHNKICLEPAHPRRTTATSLATATSDATATSLALTDYAVLIEDIGPSGLKSLGWSYRSLRAAHPQLVIVSLSPFGLRGAYADWQGSDLLAQAVGGVMHASGYAGEAPRMLPGEAAYMIAGLHGATAAITAVFGLDSDLDAELDADTELNSEANTEAHTEAKGLHIDIAAQETFMQHWTRHVAEYAYSGVPMGRGPRDPEGLHYRHTAQANDGWVYLLALREPWQDLAAFLGMGDVITGDAMVAGAPQPPWQSMSAAFHSAVAAKGKYEWFAEAAELGWTFAPVEDPFAVAASPQLDARGGRPEAACDTAANTANGSGLVPLPPLPFTN